MLYCGDQNTIGTPVLQLAPHMSLVGRVGCKILETLSTTLLEYHYAHHIIRYVVSKSLTETAKGNQNDIKNLVGAKLEQRNRPCTFEPCHAKTHLKTLSFP